MSPNQNQNEASMTSIFEEHDKSMTSIFEEDSDDVSHSKSGCTAHTVPLDESGTTATQSPRNMQRRPSAGASIVPVEGNRSRTGTNNQGGSANGQRKPGRRVSTLSKSITSSLTANKRWDIKLKSSCRNLGVDEDTGGKKDNFLVLLSESIGDSVFFFGGSILVVLAWSLLCSWAASVLNERAAADPGGLAERWVEDIESCRYALSIVGSLFVFTLVFRFNACYDRWWQGRIYWGDIISKSLELATMSRTWIADDGLADRMSRFVILFSYSSKALLRGTSLNEEGEDGEELVKRGLLAQKELDDMHDHPCWQPHYCIHMMREILVEAHSIPGGKGLKMDEGNKVHGQMFRCFDNTIKDLNNLIGDCMRVRSSGLPASYDAIVMMSFFTFFMLASMVWAVTMGWLSSIVIFAASLVIMFLIVMGTALVDPFGYDKVDIPLEAFCSTIESQINAIDLRGKSGTMSKFARGSHPSVKRSLVNTKGQSMKRLSASLSQR